MKLHTPPVFTVAFGFLLALSIATATLGAWQSDAPSPQPIQEPQAQEPQAGNLGRDTEPPTVSAAQFPVQLIFYDGVTYKYSTDCCRDGHVGALNSAQKIEPVGCNTTSVPSMSLMLPVQTFGQAHAGQTEDSMEFAYSGFDSVPSGTFAPMQVHRGTTVSDYYGGAAWQATAVKLTDPQNVERWYTLLRFQRQGLTQGGQTRNINYEFPVLVCSRTVPEINFIPTSGPGMTYMPSNQLTVAEPVSVDLKAATTEFITILLPTPQSPGEMCDTQCMLINR